MVEHIFERWMPLPLSTLFRPPAVTWFAPSAPFARAGRAPPTPQHRERNAVSATTAPRATDRAAPRAPRVPTDDPLRVPATGHRSRTSRATQPRSASVRAAPRHATHRKIVSSEAASTWRLTRRGRLVLTTGAVIVLGFGLVAAPRALATPPADVCGSWGERVVVRPGDTLWELATRAAPGADPRVVVDEIKERNGRPGSAIAAGEELLVPSVAG